MERIPIIFDKSQGAIHEQAVTEGNLKTTYRNSESEKPQKPEHGSQIESIKRLVKDGGSAAYLLYLQQADYLLREKLKAENSGVFDSNLA